MGLGLVNTTVSTFKMLTDWWGREKGNQEILMKSEKCPEGYILGPVGAHRIGTKSRLQ